MDLLEQLLNAFGVSGSEDNIRRIVSKEIKPYIDKIYFDKSGNLIAVKKGKHPKIMLAAHLDEVGLIVKNIDDRGRIYFSTIGGLDPWMLIGQRVSVETTRGLVYGIITTDEMSNGFSIKENPKLTELFIDTGLSKKELVTIDIKTGDYIFFKRRMINLGNKKIISSKALDDRIGCYILVELAKRLKKSKSEIYFTFTVQEEVGLYGARTSAYSIDPEIAIAVDVTNADDFYESATIKMGKGPCLTIKDAEMISNRAVDKWIMQVAKKNKIPLQLDVSDFGTTDALNISISKGGVPATAITVPVRNIHSTVGMANRDDIENTIRLLELALKNPPKIK
ncbi:MAG: M42 family metallopeptidase [Nanoarchaeota archaeon]